MSTFKVQLLSPDDKISFDKVISISVNGLEGELVILANYSPYMIYLLPSVITIKMSDQTESRVIIDNGILEVADNNCNILANQIQSFDSSIYDEELLKSKRINAYIGYLDDRQR
ncbi:F0F1 ATP synthase subunit epsilon [Wolbachia endosymbiont of Ctenocephalides felis wCfeT]|uniref:F0F1 ATP synthase subunit epsilon n=1 Tax=Wolbachia endosymbiont of Ctenocephalides felis wCfeT TaxID=2732593 RepID=UPI001447FDE8|nr:F0F1 ATP synthase subunit epsilon [Wolbachia endosymbiont of Ctenocephalides felis wCfeT]